MGNFFPIFTRDVKFPVEKLILEWGGIFWVRNIYPCTQDSLGSFTAFWAFSGLSLVGAVFIGTLVPETKDRSWLFKTECPKICSSSA